MKNNFSVTGIFTIEQKIYELGKRERKEMGKNVRFGIIGLRTDGPGVC